MSNLPYAPLRPPSYPDSPGWSEPDTSRAAAKSMEPLVSTIAAQVLALIKIKPRTCATLETDTGLSHQTASARITELHMKGFIEDSGRREKTPSGRLAKVWQVKLAEGEQ